MKKISCERIYKSQNTSSIREIHHRALFGGYTAVDEAVFAMVSTVSFTFAPVRKVRSTV